MDQTHQTGYPLSLVNSQFAIENGPFIVDLPIQNGDFPQQTLSLSGDK